MYGVLNLQSLVGPPLIMGLCWAISENRRRFPFRLAGGALAVQLGLMLLLFGAPSSQAVLNGIGAAVDGLSAASGSGTQFVFGYLGGGAQPFDTVNPSALFVFAFTVLPVILVICALSAMLWHLNILTWVVRAFGVLFEQTLGLRGPPAFAVAATIFMGQVEGPIFIRAYLNQLSRSELFLLLSVGMTCISGSTLVAYATILKASVPHAAAHVLAASLVSAPAGVLLARIIVPQEREEGREALTFEDTRTYASVIDAVTQGVADGLQIVLNVAATLIVFVALVALVDRVLLIFPSVLGQPLTIERGLGAIFKPLAWSLGVPWREAGVAGRLLGVKMALTEFSAFIQMSHLTDQDLSQRSRVIMTYALCGFGNIGSVGINVAGFSVLAASRRAEVLTLVWKALAAGFLATCMTASLVGALPQYLFRQ